jgi:hypothetical protein
MSVWLTRALELIEAERTAGQPGSCANSANSAESPLFGTNGTNGTRLDPADEEERTALVLVDGFVPEAYAAPFSAIQQRCPRGVPESRWWTFIRDGGAFLDWWGGRARALGWKPEDLFGFEPAAPMARYDRLGLLWVLNGRTVTALTDKTARLSDGLMYRRPLEGSANG